LDVKIGYIFQFLWWLIKIKCEKMISEVKISEKYKKPIGSIRKSKIATANLPLSERNSALENEMLKILNSNLLLDSFDHLELLILHLNYIFSLNLKFKKKNKRMGIFWINWTHPTYRCHCDFLLKFSQLSPLHPIHLSKIFLHHSHPLWTSLSPPSVTSFPTIPSTIITSIHILSKSIANPEDIEAIGMPILQKLWPEMSVEEVRCHFHSLCKDVKMPVKIESRFNRKAVEDRLREWGRVIEVEGGVGVVGKEEDGWEKEVGLLGFGERSFGMRRGREFGNFRDECGGGVEGEGDGGNRK
jgi:hypothetical protein